MSVDQIDTDGDTTANLLVEHLVSVAAGKAIADSRKVAEAFGKRHDHVLRAIDRLRTRSSRLDDTWAKHWALGFAEKDIAHPTVAGRFDRYFEMDRDAFVILVMGFTGEKAFHLKLKFIQAFNVMEAKLVRRAEAGQRKEQPKLENIQEDVQDELRIPYPDEGRYLLTISPEKKHHICEVTFDNLITEEDRLNFEILALAIRSIEAFWQKSQHLISVGIDPSEGYVHGKLEGAIIHAASLAAHFLND